MRPFRTDVSTPRLGSNRVAGSLVPMRSGHMNYDSQSFKGESIELSSNRFHGCTFERCKLVYRGDISPTMEKCEIRKHLFAGLREWNAASTLIGVITGILV